VLTLLLSCTTLDVGEWGTFRYVADLKGVAPDMPLIPPYTDRDGNVYVLWGKADEADTKVFAGSTLGGWRGGCDPSSDGQGVRGFVGRLDDQAYYWVGGTLAKVYGSSGNCKRRFSNHPWTRVELNWEAIAPQASASPSRSPIAGLVSTTVDTLPFYEIVDIDDDLIIAERGFTPANASDLRILGAGSDPYAGTFHFLVQYTGSSGKVTEVQVLDEAANLQKSIGVTMGEAEAGSLKAFLRIDSTGTGAGIFDDGSLIVYDGGAGTTTTPANFTPYGVQVFDDELFVLGVSGNQPVAAAISGGQIGQPKSWEAPLAADGKLGNISVLYEGEGTDAPLVWTDAQSAFAPAPFLTPFPLDDYAPGVTTWIVGGPSYSFSGSEVMTSIAVAPVGIGSL